MVLDCIRMSAISSSTLHAAGVWRRNPRVHFFRPFNSCPGILPLPFRNRRDGCVKRTLSPEELAGDVEGLAADDDDLLAIEKLLGDDAGEATKEMALAIDDDLGEQN